MPGCIRGGVLREQLPWRGADVWLWGYRGRCRWYCEQATIPSCTNFCAYKKEVQFISLLRLGFTGPGRHPGGFVQLDLGSRLHHGVRQGSKRVMLLLARSHACVGL